MRLILAVLAVLCGAALAIEFTPGTLTAMQIAGLGIIFAALASVAPS